MDIKSAKIQAIIFATLFFLVGVITLPHYGINWDTINHLPRGQAYLHYFLTGKKDFSDLPEWKTYWQNPDSLLIDTDIPRSEVPKRSLYQSSATTFNWFIENERGGHPPLSDILASGFNLVLFQKLRLVNDIDSYRVYGIFLASIAVFFVFWWADKIYGRFAGVIAALSLSLYPLFWSEAHFNVEKDIPETVYITSMLYFFWQGFTKRQIKPILIAGVIFGLALGTKFNVLFSLFVLFFWLIVYFFTLYNNKKHLLKLLLKEYKKIILVSIFAGILGLVIFIATWPFLWGDPISGILKVVGFYKTIGITQNIDSRFLGPLGINTYPIKWILYTTPLPVLFLLFFGLLGTIKRLKKEKDKVSLLILLAFAAPVIRVTWPGATVYGGVRQIMEFVPPMAILAGLGAQDLISKFKDSKLKPGIVFGIILAFVLFAIELGKIHPNENVYFNFLAGGLKGAKRMDLPSWGNTFGAAYRQGVSWINKNAEPDSKVVLVYELLPNIPRIFFRRDIDFQNSGRSGYLRRDEYAITLIYQGTQERSYYDLYLEEFIAPVFEASVDGVSVLKIWKNNEAHLKKPIKEQVSNLAEVFKTHDGLRFDLGQIKKLSRLEIDYNDSNCKALTFGYVRVSKDKKDWRDLPGVLPKSWKISALGEQPKDGHFIEPFVGQEARFIDLVLAPKDTCLKNVKDFKIYTLL